MPRDKNGEQNQNMRPVHDIVGKIQVLRLSSSQKLPQFFLSYASAIMRKSRCQVLRIKQDVCLNDKLFVEKPKYINIAITF